MSNVLAGMQIMQERDCDSFFDSYQRSCLLGLIGIYVLHETATQCIATTQTSMRMQLPMRSSQAQSCLHAHAVLLGIGGGACGAKPQI